MANEQSSQQAPEPAPPNLHAESTCDYAADAAAAELVRILDQYLADLKTGQAPSREELIARHPAQASQLEACLAGLEFIHGAESAAPGRAQRLGDFRILREVGRGGMGAVFEAEQISLGRRVALKVLRFGGFSDADALERFKREAETVAKLHHTNIVPIFAVGSERSVNYYAMQFIDGRSLAEVLAERKGPLPADRVADWGLQAADALAHAHQRGVIHRDVKPSNLLLDGEKRLWLTDFGLARRLDDVTLSMTGALLGTPRYMSPEQAVASKRRVDHRSDLFSLGATLYELLTGKPAFPGDTPHDVIQCILTCEPTPIRELASGVPRDLETIVMKCLAKEPDQRYSAAHELAADLRAFLDGRPIRARRASPLELATRWFKAQQRSFQLMATAAAATLAVTLVSVFGWSAYDAWRQGAIQLSTPTPPLVAEILDESDFVQRRETVPTQQAVALPSGAYRVRAAAEGLLSQTFEVELPRASEVGYSLDLRDTLLASFDVNRILTFADLGKERLSIVEAGNAGISLYGEMPPPIRPDQPPFKDLPGFRWPWNPSTEANSGFGLFDLRPWFARRGFDLNGDGAKDLVCAARHQAWLLAISGSDGKLLWFAPRGQDLQAAPQNRWPMTVTSAVLGECIVDHDCDGDGVPDVIATLADAGPSAVYLAGDQLAARLWVEALSGKSGQTLWKYELPQNWFELPAGEEVPYDCRWFAYGSSGSSMRGGGFARMGRHVYRQPGQVERLGPHVYRPDAAQIVSIAGRKLLAVVAGTHLALVDPATGRETESPLDLGVRPGRSPRIGDVDGDGAPDLVILVQRPGTPGAGPPPAKIVVYSLARRRTLWTKDLQAHWPAHEAWTIDPPQWPLVADLDGDGKCEIVVPHGSSRSGNSYFSGGPGAPWGSILALDGSSGNELWSRRLVSMDQQIDHFAAGPDIDRDGWRELYAATLSGQDERLYVDALSGQSGQILWTAHHALPPSNNSSRDFLLTPPKWWNAGPDGWPQLVVQAVAGNDARRQSLVCLFSAATGQLMHHGAGITDVEPLDFDRDGAEDLVVFDALPPGNMRDFGGQLHIVRGVPAEPWRRLGTPGEPAADFDGDAVVDLVQSLPDGTVQAHSGRTGKLLWRSQPARAIGQVGLAVAGHDLDGDGTDELVAWAPAAGPRRKAYPFHAISGRTGQVLWNATQFDVENMSRVLGTSVADLDADGQPEIIWLAASDHDYPARDSWSSHDFQLRVVVTSGRTGALRWSQPLSPAFGIGTAIAPQVQLDAERVTPTVADLDRDGTADVVLPAIAKDGSNIESRALSGKDGRLLWSRFFPPNPHSSPASMSRWVAPVVADVSPNGSRQAVFVELGPPDPGTVNAQAVLRVIGVDAASGAIQWNWGSTAWAGSWSISSTLPPEGETLRPVVARSGGGGHHLAVFIPGSNSEIAVFNGQGNVQRRSMGHQSSVSKLWVCDVDRDGADELLFLDKSSLVVTRADRLDAPLWTRDTKSAGGVRIIDVLSGHSRRAEARDALSPTIALLESTTDNSVVGLDAATGNVRWRCPGPIPRAEDGGFLMLSQLAVLGSTAAETPLVYYAYSLVSRCRRAAFAEAAPEIEMDPAVAIGRQPRGDLAALPVFAPGKTDPRWQRNLPWVPQPLVWEKSVSYFAWATFYSTLLVVIPGAYALRLAWLRQFGLRMLLALPIVAGLFLTGALTTGPADNDFSNLFRKLSMGVVFAPVVIGVVLLGWWLAKGHWRRAALWLGITFVFSLLAAAVALVQHTRFNPLAAGESYDWTGWYLIWFPSAYLTAWLAIITLPLWRLGSWLWKWRSSRPMPGGVPPAGAPTLAAAPAKPASDQRSR
jgi:outer membrane protein assembly factor BamB/predicted Ser/Thr protein kinase